MNHEEDRQRNPIFEQWLRGEPVQHAGSLAQSASQAPGMAAGRSEGTKRDNLSGNPAAELWQDGDVLVVRRKPSAFDKPIKTIALAHGRCVVCDSASDGKVLRRKLYWHSPWLYFLILLNLIVYAIAAAIVRHSLTLEVELCPRHRRKRRNALLLAGIVTPVSLIAPWFLFDLRTGSAGAAFFLGVVVTIATCIYGHFRSRVVWLKSANEDFAWVGGVSRNFLSSQPAWPGLATPTRNLGWLVAVLVSLPVLGVLVGLLLPAIQQAREAARRSAEKRLVESTAPEPISATGVSSPKSVSAVSETTASTLRPLLDSGAYRSVVDVLVQRMFDDNATEVWVFPGRNIQFVKSGERYDSDDKPLTASDVKHLVDVLSPEETPKGRFLFSSPRGFCWGVIVKTAGGNGLVIQDMSADALTDPEQEIARSAEDEMGVSTAYSAESIDATLAELLEIAVENEASEVRFAVGFPPMIMLRDELKQFRQPPLSDEDFARLLRTVCPAGKDLEAFVFESVRGDFDGTVVTVDDTRVLVLSRQGIGQSSKGTEGSPAESNDGQADSAMEGLGVTRDPPSSESPRDIEAKREESGQLQSPRPSNGGARRPFD